MTAQHTDDGSVMASLPTPGTYLCGLTWDGTRFWHSDQRAGELYALDPDTGAVVRRFACRSARADLTHVEGRLCQVGMRPKRLLLVDPDTGEVTGHKAVRPSNGRLCGTEAGPEGVWMCLRRPPVVQLRDFATMTVLREFPVEGNPSGLTYAHGIVFYSDFEQRVIRGYDVRTERGVVTLPAAGNPTGMTWDGRLLWYCDFPGRALRAIRPAVLDREGAA
ncbi:hypothetical protein BJF83_09690 [Nocardiopsis sp. CNR-923]|uniref:hypothetical protein n=1 Tax=Nocardiopsis sp. CNR-923 TaxID=1904965 RepID=UPI00095DCAE9|nr:hypothetical protein [Nocardiopsis sp. CNR-923]OLT29957.1 hypothetical protein BJF83_09690 [Nocardiopsis sp. CNR-923]